MDICNHRVGVRNNRVGICNNRVGVDRQFGLSGRSLAITGKE